MSLPMPAATCPNCTKTFDRCTDPTGQALPKPGDVTVCLYCQAVLVFTEKFAVRLMTLTEFQEAARDPEFRRAIAQAVIVCRAMTTGKQLLESRN